jgi:hypothetical protein
MPFPAPTANRPAGKRAADIFTQLDVSSGDFILHSTEGLPMQ